MARDDRDIVVVERSGGSLTWLLLGAALGAGVALLFAPKSGKEMRRDLNRGIKGLRDLADETLGELGEGRGRERDLRAMTDSGGAYDDAAEPEAEGAAPARRSRTSMESARDELERRLSAARARRRQAVPDDEEPVA